MPQAVFFAVLLVAVLVGGVVWLLRSAMRSSVDEVVEPDEPVVVGGPGAELAVEVLRSKLDAMGIDAFTRNRTGRVMPGGVPPAFAGWEVLVRSADADDARAILADEPNTEAYAGGHMEPPLQSRLTTDD